jgi:hypothetical protein|tara:strand:+ start:2984 stop:3652 length:669 start_codon:yes stop_codon:yes gene_type:complete
MIGEKINVSTFNWGPCVIKLKIIDEFKKLLLEEGKKSKIDFKDKLAGIIEDEKGFNEEAKKQAVPYMSQYLGIYDQMYQKYVLKPYDKKPEYILSALWINYQKANEFNPPHDHDGKLSFVTYLSIPEELKKEHKEYVGKSCGPGGIQFIYGDGPRDCVTYQSFFPEEGDMFIFPAWLKHWVAPFKSDCTRISVSGNIHDSAPLNAIQKFAPEYLKDKDEKAR